MDIKLKPCPYCKGTDLFIAGNTFIPKAYNNSSAIQCNTCQMRGPLKKRVVDAIVAWNKLPREE